MIFFSSECTIKRLAVGLRLNLLRAQLTIDANLQSPDPIAFIGEALWTGRNGGEVKEREWKGRGQGREGGGRKGFLQTDRCLSMCNYNNRPHIDWYW